VITCPTWVTVDGDADADVTTVSAPSCVTGTVAANGSEITGGGSDDGTPDTVAESPTVPLSMSAWVTV
jgi:hypothetical protein